MTLKLLAIFAHPDDESMGMGGALAKYAAEGVETYLVCATRGERGWFGDDESNPGLERLGEIRTQELENAGKVLGLKEIQFLNYVDADLDRANPSEAIDRIVSHIRRIQPQVVVTFAADGSYGHPDHIAISQFTTAALVCAADASYMDAENQPSHRVSKLYYMVDTETYFNFFMQFIADYQFPVDDHVRGPVAWKEWMVTTRIDVAPYWKTALDAVNCHTSQLPSVAPFLELGDEDKQKMITLQGTFYRAMSLVNGGRKTETDLFEGLR